MCAHTQTHTHPLSHLLVISDLYLLTSWSNSARGYWGHLRPLVNDIRGHILGPSSRECHAQAGTNLYVMLPFHKYHVVICNQCDKLLSELFKLRCQKAAESKGSRRLPVACQEFTFLCISQSSFLLYNGGAGPMSHSTPWAVRDTQKTGLTKALPHVCPALLLVPRDIPVS